MNDPRLLVPVERVQRSILFLRGQRVILDADVAKLYAVTTKRLNEQVRRNRERFPEDFMFQPTADEKAEAVANCDHLSRLKFSPALPHAFTEHGAIMAASVLNTPRAIEASIFVVRAFVTPREMLGAHKELARKPAELDARLRKTGPGVWGLRWHRHLGKGLHDSQGGCRLRSQFVTLNVLLFGLAESMRSQFETVQ